MKTKLILFFALAFTLFSCKDDHSDLPDGLYAVIETVKGEIIVQLEYEKTPVTVANFVTLAEGKNTFVKPEYKGKPFYDGLKFHRVVMNFMIQGGDPEGTGAGDTGYKFKDEFTDLSHDKAGTLSMANSGPNTNSSQFFITHVPTEYLDGRHTVFGHVVGNGMETVNKIVQDDGIISVKIIRNGEKAKKFDAVKTFNNYYTAEAENQKKQASLQLENEKKMAAIEAEKEKTELLKYKKFMDEKVALFAAAKSSGSETKSGLIYKIIKQGAGKRPEYGQMMDIWYAGYFENGMLFDSNIADVEKKFGKYNEQKAAQKGYSLMQFKAGNKVGLVPGLIEGLEKMSHGDKAIFFIPSELGYGEAGNCPIKPNTNMVFEIEIK
ncbi:peptidylprolyl isomerase [Flavobacterium sp. 3HN19-14]|uniref:peptidylprolyl isomerase n=1 Tax=Flavobacterium sp. 3HN19-14 TaxID=3448133 RepID=UPI003EE06BD2